MQLNFLTLDAASSLFNFMGGGETQQVGKAASLGAETTHRNVVTADLQQVEKMISDGKIKDSIDALLTLLEKEPNNQRYNSLLGTLFMTANKPALAEEFLVSAVELSEWKDATAISNMALYFRGKREVDSSIKVLNRGLTAMGNIDPLGILSSGLGESYLLLQNFPVAGDWFLKSALANPKSVDTWIKASTITFPEAGRDLQFASNVLSQAMGHHPESSPLVFHVGLLMHYKGSMSEAITLYKEAIRLDVNNSDAVSALATALHSTGDLQLAADVYEVAHKRMPNNVQLLSNYATLMVSMQKTEEALPLINKAFEIDPTHPDVVKLQQYMPASPVNTAM